MENTEFTPQKGGENVKLPTKKERIIFLWENGEHDIWQIAKSMESTPSYVASVLQDSGFINGYFDLYTSSIRTMNVYSEKFRGRLGFKDIETAQSSLKLIDETFEALGKVQDRAGQHHCMMVALTMFNRARSIGKIQEADIFRRWLIEHLSYDKDTSLGDSHLEEPH